MGAVLRWHVERAAKSEAFALLHEESVCPTVMTFEQLDLEARKIAAVLQSRNLRGQRVLLLYPSCLEYVSAVFGCFYAGAVAVPLYPPRRNASFRRLQGIANDAQASAALTSTTALKRTGRYLSTEADLVLPQQISTDDLDVSEDQWREVKID